EIIEAWDDAVVDDFDDVRLLQVLRHPIDSCSILRHRRLTKAFAIALDHFREIKIDLITRPVLHESQSIAIPNLAAHRRNPHRCLGTTAELGGPFLPVRHLDPPKLEAAST